MSDVQFTEEQNFTPQNLAPADRFAAWLVAHKLAKDVRAANLMLLGAAALALLVALFLVTGVLNGGDRLSDEDRARLEASTRPR